MDDLPSLRDIVARASGRAGALERFLQGAVIVVPDQASRVFVRLFSQVIYEDLPARGEKRRIEIVPPQLANSAQGRIPVTGALGLALLGRSPGEYLRLGARAGYPRLLHICSVGEPKQESSPDRPR